MLTLLAATASPRKHPKFLDSDDEAHPDAQEQAAAAEVQDKGDSEKEKHNVR